jgi:hypothetical protein
MRDGNTHSVMLIIACAFGVRSHPVAGKLRRNWPPSFPPGHALSSDSPYERQLQGSRRRLESIDIPDIDRMTNIYTLTRTNGFLRGPTSEPDAGFELAQRTLVGGEQPAYLG